MALQGPHELLGVAFLCIDRLEYLLSHDETVKVVGFSGFPMGSIKLNVRCWVDEIQTIPTDIITDVEANLQNFMSDDHEFIVNFQFEYLSGLPENHCTDVYISFKFMGHMPTFTTHQYLGCNPNPVIDSTVQIVKPINALLLDYIRTGCMEFKVFARRSREEVEQFPAPDSIPGTPSEHGTPSSRSQMRKTGSWRAVQAVGTLSRASSFKGDRIALERKLTQTVQITESLISEKQQIEDRLQAMEMNYQQLRHENEILQNDLLSARAEIENIYNISRGDGATILSNHSSTMMPSNSRATSFRSRMGSAGRMMRGSSANNDSDMVEVKSSKVCTIM